MLKQWLAERARWVYWHPFRKIVQFLPAGTCYALARLGTGLSGLGPKGHMLTLAREMEFLGLAKDERELRRAVAEALFLRMAMELEVLCYPRMNPGNIERFVTIEGRERLDAALAQGQGVLLLFAHFGANQMIMPAMGYNGYKMNQMSAPPTTWNKIFKGFRDSPMRERGRKIRWDCEQSLPVTHINIFGSLKKVFTQLKQNEIVGLAMDGGGGQDRVTFPFLGKSIHLSPGAMRIAMKAACPVLPVFMVATPAGPSVMRIMEPLVLDRALPEEDCLRGGIAAFVRLLEAQVTARPSHYLSFMAWRTQNAGLGEPAFLTGGPEA